MRDQIKLLKNFFFPVLFILVLCLPDYGCKQNEPDKTPDVQKSQSAEKPSQYVFGTENLKRYKFPTHINDIIVDRAQSSFSEAFMVIIEPEKAPPFHKHDDTEQIFYMISGKGVLTIGDLKNQFQVKPGDVVRIPVSTLHSIKANEKDTVKYLCVDCFGSKPRSEPTWESHVRTLCRDNGWDFEKVSLAHKTQN